MNVFYFLKSVITCIWEPLQSVFLVGIICLSSYKWLLYTTLKRLEVCQLEEEYSKAVKSAAEGEMDYPVSLISSHDVNLILSSQNNFT